MAEVALCLLGVYGTFVFGWGYLNRRRRYKVTPLRLRHLRGPALVIALLMTAGFGLLVAGPVAAIAHVDRAIGQLDVVSAHAAGVVVFLGGLAVVALAQGAMGASWRVGVDPAERTELVTHGPFRFVRNPIYSSVVAMAVGVGLMVGNVVSILAAGILAVGVGLQVHVVEEPYLSAIHGRRYREYCTTTGRFVPSLGRACRVVL